MADLKGKRVMLPANTSGKRLALASTATLAARGVEVTAIAHPMIKFVPRRALRPGAAGGERRDRHGDGQPASVGGQVGPVADVAALLPGDLHQHEHAALVSDLRKTVLAFARCLSGSVGEDQESDARVDEELDHGTEALVRDLKRLMQANMEDEIDRFILALSEDHVLPEDF